MDEPNKVPTRGLDDGQGFSEADLLAALNKIAELTESCMREIREMRVDAQRVRTPPPTFWQRTRRVPR